MAETLQEERFSPENLLEEPRENPPPQNNRLGTEPVGKLLFKLALPAIIAQLINMLYNIVDRIYIARLHVNEALSGLTVCFPVVMIVSAFAALIGQGGAPLASIKMGQKRKEDAERILGVCFTMLVAAAIVLTVGLELTKKPILSVFGATASALPYADEYLTIYLAGTIFVMFSLGLNAFITAQGFSKTAMLTVAIGALVNIILDPIFIFGLNMGVRGAAVATFIAQAVSAVWVLFFLFGKKTQLRIRLRLCRPTLKIIGPVLALGLSPFVMQITESIIQLNFNAGFKRFAATVEEGTINVAAMGVMLTIMQLVAMPINGLGQGAQPVISYNYGAGNHARVRRAFKLLFIWSMALAVAMFALVEAVPQVFAAPLSPSKEVLDYAAKGTRIFMAGSFMLGMQFSCQSTFVALGRAKVSLFLALLRKIILLVPLALILPLFVVPNTLGLLLAEPIADVTAALTTFTMFLLVSRKVLRAPEKTGIQQDRDKAET